MRIERPPRIARPIPLTPLIDVVFLLLMFFMLSTTFAKFGLFGMGRTAAAGAAASTAAAAKLVLIELSHGPTLVVNGRAVALPDLAARLNSFQALGADRAILRAAADADVQDLVTALEAARRSRLTAISLGR